MPGLLLQAFGGKLDQYTVRKMGSDRYRIAAHLTVLYVALNRDRGVQQHRNVFPAIRTLKKVFVHPIYNKRFRQGSSEIHIEQLPGELQQLQLGQFGIVFCQILVGLGIQ